MEVCKEVTVCEQIFSAGVRRGICSVAGGNGILGLCDLLENPWQDARGFCDG